MSGADNIVFNTREKVTSADQNDAQSLEARTLATILRFATMSRVSGLGTAADTEVINPQCNGLQVIPNGSSVLIKPGYLLQESATISPVPGALDSPYRISLNHANMAPTAVAPSPGSDTYYLLEAQMVETDTLTESRSVLNATTGNFVATSVTKRRERRLVTAWRTGGATSYPIPTGGDWVVLAGVFRPGGGGAVLQTHIQDMRLQPDLLVGEAQIDRATRARVSEVSVTSDNDVLAFVSAEADAWTGATNRALRLSVRNWTGIPPGFNPSNAAILSPATTLAGATWYYLYLAPWSGLAPRVALNDVRAALGVTARGVLVLSHIAPTAFTSGNSASITLPPPFGNVTALAGEARCVAILRRNAANNGWRAMHGAGDSYRLAGVGPTLLTDTGTFPGVMNVAVGQLPVARLLKLAIHMAITLTGTTSAEAYLKFETRITGSSDVLNAQRIPLPGASTTTRWDLELDVPYSDTGYDFQLSLVAVSGTLTAASGTFNAYCAGWTF